MHIHLQFYPHSSIDFHIVRKLSHILPNEHKVQIFIFQQQKAGDTIDIVEYSENITITWQFIKKILRSLNSWNVCESVSLYIRRRTTIPTPHQLPKNRLKLWIARKEYL